MLATLFFGSLVLAVAYCLNSYRLLQHEIAAAKRSGLPYVILPIYLYNRFWLLISRLVIPILEQTVPQSWQGLWLKLLGADWNWTYGHEPFKEVGSDVFLTVSPGGTMAWIASAEVNSQITTRRNDFPKALALYKSLNIFGINVVTTEGATWRHHRKITSPSFTEKNNNVVWRETLSQATKMMQIYFSAESTTSPTITDLPSDTMRLTLYIISKAGFGKSLQWPELNSKKAQNSNDKSDVYEKGEDTPDGHIMSYADALQTLLHNIILIIIAPQWLLRNSRFEVLRTAYDSFIEWGKYQQDIFETKKNEIRYGTGKEGLDLMGALIKGAGITRESLEKTDKLGVDKSEVSKGKSTVRGQLLSDEEILGNAFVFILAGHETTGNTLHFAILNLALHLSAQRSLQAHLDTVLDDRPAEILELEKDFQKLAGGYTGAVLNETLRLFPPVLIIPKNVTPQSDQQITMNGKTYVLPAGAGVNLNAYSTQINSAYWPPVDRSDADDIHKFKPERWTKKHEIEAVQQGKPDTVAPVNSDIDGPSGQGTAASLFQPIRGSYIPFSDGYRGCLGRRFAQVEMAAVLAVIFSRYSVELAVDEWASDAEVAQMDSAGRKAVWNTAADRARWLMKEGAGSKLTLQLQQGNVNVRFVPRGSERFDFAS